MQLFKKYTKVGLKQIIIKWDKGLQRIFRPVIDKQLGSWLTKIELAKANLFGIKGTENRYTPVVIPVPVSRPKAQRFYTNDTY